VAARVAAAAGAVLGARWAQLLRHNSDAAMAAAGPVLRAWDWSVRACVASATAASLDEARLALTVAVADGGREARHALELSGAELDVLLREMARVEAALVAAGLAPGDDAVPPPA
jgi:hypothetical protein